MRRFNFHAWDIYISLSAGFLIPRTFFHYMKKATGIQGGGAITKALKNISLDIGSNAGVSVLIFLGVIFYMLSKYCFKLYYLKQFRNDAAEVQYDFKDDDEIIEVIKGYHISRQLQTQIFGEMKFKD